MRIVSVVLLFAIAVWSGCKKETEEFSTAPLSDYLPVQTGKTITYRLDSTVFINFGTGTDIRSYQEKHEIDATFTDAQGRTAYRVFRSLRNADGTGPWKPAGTYTLVPGKNAIEKVENNLRFLQLAAPIKEANTWKGNRYLPFDPYGASYSFSNDDNMGEWNYTYTTVDATETINSKPLNHVVTVEQANESANAPVTQSSAYGYINYSVTKFAKDIGLVYEELTMWEYQPNPSGNSGYKTGFGIKRSLLDHN